MSIKVLDSLQKRLEDHEKHLVQSSEDAHTDDLLHRRMTSLHIFITTHYEDNVHRRRMLEAVEHLKQESTLALEHKE